ncbi:hypothetical protein LTS10_003955 [Elasticomyces elasticus]|nr:hypothetical protein LTS10_003955 [Elasticomyces elasticus]
METTASDPLARPPGISGPSASKMSVYHGLDQEMMQTYHQGNVEEAERLAHILTAYADLPLVFRARASTTLGCSGEPGYLEWATDAVHFAQLAVDNAQGRPAPVERKLLASCQEMEKKAKQAYEEEAKEAAAGEQTRAEGVQEAAAGEQARDEGLQVLRAAEFGAVSDEMERIETTSTEHTALPSRQIIDMPDDALVPSASAR